MVAQYIQSENLYLSLPLFSNRIAKTPANTENASITFFAFVIFQDPVYAFPTNHILIAVKHIAKPILYYPTTLTSYWFRILYVTF